MKESEILIADFDLLAPHAYALKNMKWVQGTFAGIDGLKPHVDFKNPPKYIISRFSGNYFSQIMLEYVLANVINHERGFYQMYDNQKNKNWNIKNLEGTTERNLTELVFAILGVGYIGSSSKINYVNIIMYFVVLI